MSESYLMKTATTGTRPAHWLRKLYMIDFMHLSISTLLFFCNKTRHFIWLSSSTLLKFSLAHSEAKNVNSTLQNHIVW